MSGHVQRSGGRRSNNHWGGEKRSRNLRIEVLEARTVLSGVVDIHVAPSFPTGTLTLVGDGSNNQVEIRQTTTPNEFFISSPDDTLFQINGAGVTVPDATINGITGQITVDLGDGNDLFRFLEVSAGVASNVPSHLAINNRDGSDTNILSNVLVNGSFSVNKPAGSSGYSELQILNSTVIGDTNVNNVGSGAGDTRTVIDHSILQGGGPLQDALTLDNPSGSNIVDVLGQSQFGTGSFIGSSPIVIIRNSGGGSRITFTGASQVAGPGTTTVYGDLQIINGPNVVGTLNITTFNNVNVLGYVHVTNGDGDTESVVMNATLGSEMINPGVAGTAEVLNGAGFDSFTMTGSTAQWGLNIDNDNFSRGTSNWGSSTEIINSSIGTHPFGPALATPGDALVVSGDNARDSVHLSQATLGGRLNLGGLFNGNNVVNLENSSSMASLYLIGGTGDESVTINNTRIIVSVHIHLNDGADSLRILNENLATQWPSPLLGDIEVDGGIGVDTINVDALLAGALNFELVVP